MDIEAHAEMLSISKSLPAYVPSTLPLLLNWIDSFLGAARGATAEFPAVFNASGIYNVHRATALRQLIADCTASLEGITTYQRGVTALRQRLLYRREMDAIANVPRPDPAMILPAATTSPISGLAHIVVAMAEMLKKQPNYKEDVHGRQFGLLPQGAPPVDPATLDPQVSGRFTGGEVVLTFRSPRDLRGVDVAEIKCDRNDGTGEQFIGSTVRARFTDHHDLPAGRAVWSYAVCYKNASGVYVGRRSLVDVVIEGRGAIGLDTPKNNG